VNTNDQLAILVGALAGLGLFLIVRGFVPTRPTLGATLDQLHGPVQVYAGGRGAGPVPGQLRSAAVPGSGLVSEPVIKWLRPPIPELRLIGQTVERYVLEKISFSLFGLMFPTLLSVLLKYVGVHVNWIIPTIVAIALAVAMFFLVDANIKQKAGLAREEFRRAVATYLTLVGLVRYGGAGAVESMESAARIGDGWVFDRIRSALEDARYANEAPWARLRQVSTEIGVPDLGDVGDIMGLVGDQGAQVYQTLLARSTSLRVALRTKEQQRAATATTLLYVPTSMLLLVFLVLIGYPAISQIAG
jgi:tight adherence protein C